MAYNKAKVSKAMVQPINLIFRYLQNRARVSIWVYEQVNTRIEGYIVGFDEYMNLVLDEAVELNTKKQAQRKLGRIMLKGDNITVIQKVQGVENQAWTGHRDNLLLYKIYFLNCEADICFIVDVHFWHYLCLFHAFNLNFSKVV